MVSTVIHESSRTALECALRFISEHMFILFMDNTACLLIAFCRHSFSGRYGLTWRTVFLTQASMYQCSTGLVKLCSIACLLSFIENTATLFRVGFKNIEYLSSTKIGFHKQFVLECKGCLIAFKDRLEDRALSYTY